MGTRSCCIRSPSMPLLLRHHSWAKLPGDMGHALQDKWGLLRVSKQRILLDLPKVRWPPVWSSSPRCQLQQDNKGFSLDSSGRYMLDFEYDHSAATALVR